MSRLSRMPPGNRFPTTKGPRRRRLHFRLILAPFRFEWWRIEPNKLTGQVQGVLRDLKRKGTSTHFPLNDLHSSQTCSKSGMFETYIIFKEKKHQGASRVLARHDNG